MFGLLTHRPQKPELRAEFMMNYCGTCKAIGKMYGHKQRLLLNYDVVFLSELLASLSNRPEDFDAISVYRCFSLPDQQSQLPAFLAYSASVNMLLASIKVQDNIEDSGFKSLLWKMVALWQKKKSTKARLYLEQSGLNMSVVDAHVKEQVGRERQKKIWSDLQACCSYYAEMTGSLTGEIFRQGANVLGKPSAADDMFNIGKAFGELVYLTDALVDYKKDLRKNSFNPLLLMKTMPGPLIPKESEEMVHQMIASNVLLIKRHLNSLPIADTSIRSFAERLDMNIDRTLHTKSACVHKTSTIETGISVYQKYQQALGRAKMNLVSVSQNPFRKAGMAIAATVIAFVVLLFPFRLFASSSVAPPSESYWDECCNNCCQGCCDSICNSICGGE